VYRGTGATTFIFYHKGHKEASQRTQSYFYRQALQGTQRIDFSVLISVTKYPRHQRPIILNADKTDASNADFCGLQHLFVGFQKL